MAGMISPLLCVTASSGSNVNVTTIVSMCSMTVRTRFDREILQVVPRNSQIFPVRQVFQQQRY